MRTTVYVVTKVFMSYNKNEAISGNKRIDGSGECFILTDQPPVSIMSHSMAVYFLTDDTVWVVSLVAHGVGKFPQTGLCVPAFCITSCFTACLSVFVIPSCVMFCRFFTYT